MMLYLPVRRPFALLRLSLAFVLTLLPLGSVLAASVPISFTEPTLVPTLGTNSFRAFAGVAKGDFNGDGKLDVAALYTSGDGFGHLEITLGNGDGTFGAPTQMVIPQTAAHAEVDGVSLLAKDLNGDGKLDLALTTSNKTVLVFLGNGDGTFGTAISTTLPADGVNLQSADLNGDGKMDLVTVLSNPYPQSTNEVGVLLGNGDGTFQTPVAYAVEGNPSDLALADVDKQHGPDIVVGTVGGQSIDVLLNNGSGTFAAYRSTHVAKAITGLYVADFDGDGKLDVVAGGNGQIVDGTGYHIESFVFLKGVGDGTFLESAAANDFPVGSANPTRTESENVTPDLNGDGKADVVFADGVQNLMTVGLGDGHGNFHIQTFVAEGGSGIPGQGVDGAQANSFVFGQFTGHALPDMVVGSLPTNSGPGSLSLIRANPAKPGAFLAPYAYSTGDPAYTIGDLDSTVDFALGDFLHNGTVSLATVGTVPNGQGGSLHGVLTLAGLGDGTFADLLPYPAMPIYSRGNLPAIGTAHGLGAADLNGDGFLDLVYSSSGGGPSYQDFTYSQGNGQFGGGGSIATPGQFLANNTTPEFADFNRSGRAGFVVSISENSGTHYFVITNGIGMTADINPGTASGTHGFAAGDFDGDGKPDLIVHTTAPERLQFYKGNGDGTFQAPVLSSPGLGAFQQRGGRSQRRRKAGPDLRNPQCRLRPARQWRWDVPAGRLLHRAKLQHLCDLWPGRGRLQRRRTPRHRRRRSDGRRRLPGNGDGTLGAPQTFALGYHGYSSYVHAADLNGDGKPDLVYSVGIRENNYYFVALLNGLETPPATHILWDNVNGQASLYSVFSDGTYTHHEYGPFPGYTARAIADGPDGNTRILWTKSDGTTSVWNVAPDYSYTYQQYGPFAGYSAVSVSAGNDNVTHLLFDATSGAASLFALNDQGGYSVQQFGPFPGYTANAIAGHATTDILWTNVNGMAADWEVAANGTYAVQQYGPFNGYHAQALAVGPDNAPHPLWDTTNGATSLWTVSLSNGSYTYTPFGPFSGWTAVGDATGQNNVTHLLWDNTSGLASLWNVTGSGYTHTEFGPFSGWTAVAVSAGP